MRECLVVLFIACFSVNVSATDFSDTTKHKQQLATKGKTIRLVKRYLKKEGSINDSAKLQYMKVLQFKQVLGWIESKNNYGAISQPGFYGRYAISGYVLGKLSKQSPKQFLKDSIEQERVMNESIFLYLRYIKREKMLKHLNKKIGGMTMTLEMLMAGTHFSPTYLELFLRSNGKTNKNDGKISIGSYMAFFELRE